MAPSEGVHRRANGRDGEKYRTRPALGQSRLDEASPRQSALLRPGQIQARHGARHANCDVAVVMTLGAVLPAHQEHFRRRRTALPRGSRTQRAAPMPGRTSMKPPPPILPAAGLSHGQREGCCHGCIHGGAARLKHLEPDAYRAGVCATTIPRGARAGCELAPSVVTSPRERESGSQARLFLSIMASILIPRPIQRGKI